MCVIYIWNNVWCVSLWLDGHAGLPDDTDPPHSCRFLGQSHTQTLLSSVSLVTGEACVCARSAVSVHIRRKEKSQVDTLPLFRRAPNLVTFCSWPFPVTQVYFSKHGCRRKAEWRGMARLKGGQGWKGTERAGRRGLLKVQCSYFTYWCKQVVADGRECQSIPNTVADETHLLLSLLL